MIPDTYDTWRHCIEFHCGLALDPPFVRERIAELEDLEHFRTRQFVALYGEPHRERVLGWFRQALASA